MATVAVDEPQVEPAPKPKQEPREYVVLVATGEPNGWYELPETGWGINEKAAKDDAASRLPLDEQAGRFVGVPVRSWKPADRTVETRTRSRWS